MDQAEVRRGWVKLHISCDIANHLSVEVTDEHTADGKEFSKLGAMDKVNKVFGDSAYDSRDNFNSVQAMGAEPVIKPKINSIGKSKG
ncbi:MAG: transposase [Conexivisphaerales archaeon]